MLKWIYNFPAFFTNNFAPEKLLTPRNGPLPMVTSVDDISNASPASFEIR